MLGKADVVIMKQSLKKQMKKQKKSYKDLANFWGCSEVTAKRVLNKEELSVSRLASLLKWLELEFSDLTLLMEKEKHVCRCKLTVEQENYFDNNPSHLAFFLELYGDEPVDKLAKRYAFNKKTLTKVLAQLDRFDLIEWGESDKLHVKHPEQPEFIRRGKLQKRFYKNAIEMSSQIFLDRIEKRLFSLTEPDEPGGYLFVCLELHPTTFKEACKQMKKIFDETHRKARQERLVYNKSELKTYAIAQGFTDMDDISDHDDFIKKVFGETSGPISDLATGQI